MKLAAAVFGVATLVGVGYVIGKKVFDKKKDDDDDRDDVIPADPAETDGEEPKVYASAKERYEAKIRKASLFAVGAIKTSADKLGETIRDIKTKDMVKKGEETMDAVKEAGDNIKKDIEDLKSMVSSINEEEAARADDLFDEPEPDSEMDESDLGRSVSDFFENEDK